MLWISLAALLIGASLVYIEKVAFADDTTNINYRERMSLGRIGLAVVACGTAGFLLEVIT